MVLITADPIDPSGMYRLIAKKGCGSVLFHYAVVKEQAGKGGVTCHIEYTVNGDAEDELRAIAGEIVAARDIEDILLVRRIGTVGVGEIISLVAVSSPASDDALTVCREGIARLKRMRTIVKNEVCGRVAEG
jgi:molybdopterin synthase catalytic subunit